MIIKVCISSLKNEEKIMVNSNLHEVTFSEFINHFFSLCDKQNTQFSAYRQDKGITPSVPIIVGAGISATADIPLNFDLLNKLGEKLNLESEKSIRYEDIYDKIKMDIAVIPSGTDSILKRNLRATLLTCGIQRIRDFQLPNDSNLLLSHLLESKLLGPVISLNVDALLHISTSLLPARDEIKFIHNLSQYSDLSSNDRKYKLVLQPHGTIEEPLSLRFIEEELSNKEYGITSKIKDLIADDMGILCVGINWVDRVAQTIIENRLDGNSAKFKVLIAIYDKEINQQEMDNIQKLASDNRGKIDVILCKGIDSDFLFNAIYEEALVKTAKARSNSSPNYHVSSCSEALLRQNFLKAFKKYHNRNKEGHLDYIIIFELFLHALSVNSYFSYEEISESLIEKKYLKLINLYDLNKIIEKIKYSLEFLIDHKILTKVENLHPSSFGELLCCMLHICTDKSKEQLISSFLEIFFAKFKMQINNSERIKFTDELKKMIGEAETRFDIPSSVALGTHFEEAEIILNHKDLDDNLDVLKKEFQVLAINNEQANCRIITETGAHLLKTPNIYNDFAENLDSLNENNLKEYLREWLHPIYGAEFNHNSSLRIVVSKSEHFVEGLDEKKIKVLRKALDILSKRPKIMVSEAKWDKHDDHMWSLQKTIDGEIIMNAMLFPRIHGKRNTAALQIKEKGGNGLLQPIFKHLESRHSYSFNNSSSKANFSPVLAFTFVDGATLSDDGNVLDSTKVLVCIRNDDKQTHANVVSVPTRRFPEACFDGVLSLSKIDDERPNTDDTGEMYILEAEYAESGQKATQNSVISAIDTILARKLGLSDALEDELISFKGKPVVLKAGPSPVFSNFDEDEPIKMINIFVILNGKLDLIPSKTSSYQKIFWLTAGQLVENIRLKKVMTTNEAGEEYNYLCGGICVCTADALIKTMSEH